MPNSRIVFFTKYTRAGASSRYRTYQYLDAFRAAGLACVVKPLFDEAYLAHKYRHGKASWFGAFAALVGRLWAVLTVPARSIVMIEYELLPYFPAVLERWLVFRGCRMLVDYDDALFHQYDQHGSVWVRRLLGGKIATVMRLAHTVVAGNEYLADYAKCAGARRVEIIPTVIDLLRYPARQQAHAQPVFTIGWIGSPSTANYLYEIAPALAEFCARVPARVRLVGSGPVALPGVPVDLVTWQEHTEVDEISGFEVGIMPLPDEPWARGKCGFKLIQYMACGLPVIASPVGVNAQLVEHGVNGFQASTVEQWLASLHDLYQDAELRQRLGAAGRQRVAQQYCLAVTTPIWLGLLGDARLGR
ncbi:glycosyltransferase family 4 protein [Alcanivorax sp. 1008]|uniref:glycosyltransferase family 4 protein n=1 Tax=Alcanivorax sp. 1008 TaxID=2816853 RepID=UPI001DDDA81D|nr:glycosyltransferase family 4 protein [Alcanivorax sp. 1008]MCC1498226.1 glycosyltransferase family 4 protein [Alcanivorax sp. 1008]